MKLGGNMMVFLMFELLWCFAGGAAPSVEDQCANDFQKVTACLAFATGKQDAPSEECCTSVTDIKGKDPVCLCYFIQQIHDGNNPQLKSLGIQEARLLQLPFACKLQNASSAECPKLLNLPPNSPDIAIFTNASSSATPSTTTAQTPPGAPSSSAHETSNGFKDQPPVAGPVAIAVAIFLCSFPRGQL